MSQTPSRNDRYRKYLLGMLLAIYVSNHLDRLALGIVLQNIKADLALSDAQLGLLTGIAFAAFYAVMGIPLARWADRGNRIAVITLCTALWGIAVPLCAAARNFVQLLAIRVAVAVGEAGCIPPAHSLIADHFSRTERPRAVSLYVLGDPLSVVGGFFLAGWLNEFYGWRATFVILGLPGILLAALAGTTLIEPRRRKLANASAWNRSQSDQAAPTLKEVWTVLWGSHAFRHLLVCFSLWYFCIYGLIQWQPAFFMRSHGLSSGEVGTWFAAIYGTGGALGIYFGGAWAAGRAAGHERLQLRVCSCAFVVFALFTACAYVVTSSYLAFAALGLSAFGGNIAQGPMLASIQTLVPPRMRAMSLAIIYFFANLIGFGLGPLVVGVLSDALRPHFGLDSLRYALVAVCPGYLWAAWHLWRAGRFVEDEIAGLTASSDAVSGCGPMPAQFPFSEGRP
jgi:MFS transporter, Spinster family, sphingosine-1-phosphate transporter